MPPTNFIQNFQETGLCAGIQGDDESHDATAVIPHAWPRVRALHFPPPVFRRKVNHLSMTQTSTLLAVYYSATSDSNVSPSIISEIVCTPTKPTTA